MTAVRSAPAPAPMAVAAPHPDGTRAGASRSSVLLFAAAAALLVLATWLYGGYRSDSGNTPGLIQFVLHFNGELQGDWYTSLPPSHWLVDHALALVPSSLLEAALLVCWLLFLGLFWGAFLDICRSLGAPVYVGLAAGLVLIPTRAGGFGVSELLFDFFYPNGLSTALALAGLALILRGRMTWAGVALGAAVLIHPGVGPLAVLAIAPMALLAMDRRDLRSLLRFFAPIVVIGFASVLQLLLDGVSGSGLSDHQRYEFAALVRLPHHLLYRAFPTFEYVRTGLWLAGLTISLGLIWRLRSARLLAVLTGTILAISAVGAAASEAEWPFLLVNAQTSRLSALVVVLAVAAMAAALSRMISPVGAALALLGAFLLGPELQSHLGRWFPSWGTLDAAEAILLLAVLLAGAGFLALGRPGIDQAARWRWWRPVAAGAVAVVFVSASVSMIVEHDERAERAKLPDEEALKDVAGKAEQQTEPGDLVLGSPTDDGLRVFARRADVVEYGYIELGRGALEWRQRIFDLTGNPRALDPGPDPPLDIADRKALLDAGYQQTIQTSTLPICKYDAKVVIAAPLERPPPWLTPVYRNEYFELYDVRPGTCPAPPS